VQECIVTLDVPVICLSKMNNSSDKKMDVEGALDLLTKRKTWEDFFLRTPCVKSSELAATVGTYSAPNLYLHVFPRSIRLPLGRRLWIVDVRP
jgi:hypothetical protein